MVEILKPNDYKKIIEGLYELNDEMDIMQHLENYHAKYAEDNYHFSAILSQKISEVDDYDTTEDVQRYYYNKANNDPYCKIVLYIDAPNAVIRFAKVYIDYLAYCDDLVYPEDNNSEENEIREEEILKFKSVLNKEQLLQVHKYLTDNHIIASSSAETFIGLFSDWEGNLDLTDKIKWQLSHFGNNYNLPMFTLFWAINGMDNILIYDSHQRRIFFSCIKHYIEPANRKTIFSHDSLKVSFFRWARTLNKFQKGEITQIDKASNEILSFIQNL